MAKHIYPTDYRMPHPSGQAGLDTPVTPTYSNSHAAFTSSCPRAPTQVPDPSSSYFSDVFVPEDLDPITNTIPYTIREETDPEVLEAASILLSIYHSRDRQATATDSSLSSALTSPVSYPTSPSIRARSKTQQYNDKTFGSFDGVSEIFTNANAYQHFTDSQPVNQSPRHPRKQAPYNLAPILSKIMLNEEEDIGHSAMEIISESSAKIRTYSRPTRHIEHESDATEIEQDKLISKSGSRYKTDGGSAKQSLTPDLPRGYYRYSSTTSPPTPVPPPRASRNRRNATAPMSAVIPDPRRFSIQGPLPTLSMSPLMKFSTEEGEDEDMTDVEEISSDSTIVVREQEIRDHGLGRYGDMGRDIGGAGNVEMDDGLDESTHDGHESGYDDGKRNTSLRGRTWKGQQQSRKKLGSKHKLRDEKGRFECKKK